MPINPNISLSFKPADPFTTIGSMLNIANAQQQYQQAQQLNPLQVQAAQEQLRQAVAINPELLSKARTEARIASETAQPTIERAQSAAEQARTEAARAAFGLQGDKRSAALTVAGSYAVNPDVQPNATPERMRDALDSMVADLMSRGLTAQEAAFQVGPLYQLAMNNPKALANALQNAVRQGAGSATQAALQTPSVQNIGNVPQLFTPGTGTVSPVRTEGASAAPGAPQAAPQAPQGPTQGGVTLRYPARPAGAAFVPDVAEAQDLKTGQDFRQGIVSTALNAPSTLRNLDEVIKVTDRLMRDTSWYNPTTGIAGNVNRKVRTALGDTTYQELSKDLANVQITNFQANGGKMDSVEGLRLQRLASGDETYAPEVLMKIAQRTRAEVSMTQAMARGAKKFGQLYGDQNMETFKQVWSNNADPRLFQARDIWDAAKNGSVQAKEAAVKKINDLLGTNPDERKALQDKWKVLQKLENEGALQ